MSGINSIIKGVERFDMAYPYLGVLVSKLADKELVIAEKGSVIGLEHEYVQGEACPCCGARISDIVHKKCGLCDWQAFAAGAK